MIASAAAIRLTFAPGPRPPDAALAPLDRLMTHLRFDDDARYRFLLAAHEGLVNALRHGGSTAPVELTITFDGGRIVARIADRGPGFDPGAVPDPRAPRNRMKTSGRGLFLMREWTYSLEYSARPGGGSVITLRSHRPEGPCRQ